MSTLKEIDIENFWLKCYFNPSTSLKSAAVDRAYRDFNRTLHKISKVQSQEKHLQAQKLMLIYVDDVCNKIFENQSDFDFWHEERCYELVNLYKTVFNFEIYIGQSQKWINMTFKYLAALSERRISGISKNYKYFHFPVDNVIQKVFAQYGIKRIRKSWSRIDNYSDYIAYQNLVRAQYPNKIPLDIEFLMFNGDTSLW